MKRVASLVAVAALLILSWALPGTASGAVTFGSDLGDPPTDWFNPGFTNVLRTLDAGDLAPGGVTAPSDGVITHWRVEKGAGAITLGFRVIRGNTSTYQGGATPVPDAAGTYQFDVHVPVQSGDAIGVDQLSSTTALIGAGGGTVDFWLPLLGPAETLPPSGTVNNSQLLINADLEQAPATETGQRAAAVKKCKKKFPGKAKAKKRKKCIKKAKKLPA